MAKNVTAKKPSTRRGSADDSSFVTNEAAQNFIAHIQRARQSGFGFVPFIGAGFSAPSGAPLVDELKLYLQRCVCMALGAEARNMEAWDPRTDQWPPFIDRTRPEPAGGWPAVIHGELLRRTNMDDCELPILAEGFGAAAEWRTSLLFLSRLVGRPRGSTAARGKLHLDVPSQEIVDSCLREVLKGKHPSLEHNMLAVLAGALRLDLIVTTNFDDLLERAFAAARNPLQVFEVHLGDPLPHWSAVSDVRSLIKLHGNRHALRADYSLDEPPSEGDKQRFLEYLLSPVGRSDFRLQPDRGRFECQNHLLVMGCAGQDRRTRELIRYAWKQMDESFQVFWLCYSEDDVKKAHEMTDRFRADFKRRAKIRGREPMPEWNGSVILRYPYFGHFLLQLYQNIRKNLPPLGTLFPSVSRLTLPPLMSSNAKNNFKTPAWDKFCENIRTRLECFDTQSPSVPKLVVAYSRDGVRGVTSACSNVFRDIEARKVCLWLDMNDISGADNLFEVLLEAAYFRLGLENWTPVYLAGDDPRPLADEIVRLVRSVNKSWVIFLNARETPGANTDEDEDAPVAPARPHGWLDDDRAQAVDASHCCQSFLDLLTELCGSTKVSIVLMCRKTGEQPGLIRELQRRKLLRTDRAAQNGHHAGDGDDCGIELRDNHSSPGLSEREIVCAAIRWADTDSRRRFLHTLVLMQRPRLLATIWSPAMFDASGAATESKEGERLEWLDELESRGLIRRKAGGFIWIHARCRQRIRRALRNGGSDGELDQAAVDALKAWNTTARVPEIHSDLAEWYYKVLDACESPAAVFEAAYHLCRASEAYANRKEMPNGYVLAAERLETAAALLQANSFLVQTHGYSRGSCRRLEHVRDILCSRIEKLFPSVSDPQPQRLQTAVQSLRLICTEVMRAIAREVGEDLKTYRRHTEFGQLLVTGKLLPDPPKHLSKLVCGALERAGEPQRAKSDWLRWWRWSGMCAMASRSFPMAYSAYEKGLICAQGVIRYPLSGGNVDWPALDGTDLPQQEMVEVLRIKELFVELSLLRSNVRNRLSALREDDKGARPPSVAKPDVLHLEVIERDIREGRLLASRIRGKDHSSDSHATIYANWAEGRLLMHQSVCAALRMQADIEAKGRLFQTAMGLLGDAEASLRISDARRYRTELALVELHRAEVRLREADSVPVVLPGGGETSFASLYRELERTPNEVDWRTQGEVIRAKFCGVAGEAPSALRRAQSLAGDALRFLTRAEPVLRERRRNVWWTTWFFERYLRSIALSVWASVFEKGTPIPFLGLEAAMRLTDTLADTLLSDAGRMIRVDAYRLATILDAYASCTKALQLRLMLDPDSVRLHERQKQMFDNLESGLRKMDAVADRRQKDKNAKLLPEKDQMDPEVASYVQAIRRKITGMAVQLERVYH